MKNPGFLPLVSLAAAALMLQACAGTPPETAPSPKATAAAPKQNMNQPSDENLDPVVAEAAKGYERVVKNGELFFCRREQPIGSKMWTTNCVNEAQLRQRAEDAKKMRESSMGQGRRCSQGPGCQN